MKKAAEKFRQLAPFLVFFLLVFSFHLLFARLMPKTDDGNFLSIVSDPAFSYAGWLRERYLTVSGRTVGEFLLAFFLKKPIVFWKLLNSLAITFVAWFWRRLSLLFGEKKSEKASLLFCCCGLFTVTVSCLNPAAFWFSGSFSYLWPFAGLFVVVEPFLEVYFTGRVGVWRVLLSLPFALIATTQEQSALCCAALCVLLVSAAISKHKKVNVITLLLLLPVGLGCWHLFSAPGIRGRTAMETGSAFAAYGSFGLFEKLFCGAANYFADAYFFGLFLLLLFSALLLMKIFQTESTRAARKVCFFCGATELLGVFLVLTGAACAKTLPHLLVRAAFLSGRFSAAFGLLFAGGCLITAAVLSLLIVLTVHEKAVGLPVGVCAAAAFCSALAMGFSPTVFASGQRTFFFTYGFLFSACVLLFSSLDEGKQKAAAFKATVVYACGTFFLECMAFPLFEHPLMG